MIFACNRSFLEVNMEADQTFDGNMSGLTRRGFGVGLGFLAFAAAVKSARALPAGGSLLVNGRTGLVIPVAKDDQPTLHFSTTSSYDDVWWGHKMHGCTASVHVWRPRVPSGWFILGDTAVSGSNYPTGPAVIVRESNPAAKGPILAPPEPDGWNQIWNDSGTGGAQDGSIWQPRPKDGYVAIGSVAASGYNQPSIPSYMCVRFDKCAPSTAT